jgi:Protein of unknown function (DUF2934)
MTRESLEELRGRLLRDPEVQTMIRMRAYEIYRIRGEEPGRQAEDWFQAQGEVLEFLIEEESRHAAELKEDDVQVVHAMAASPTGAPAPEATGQPTRPVEQTAASAESENSLGVWSVTEPDSARLAPPVGKATEFQIDAPSNPRARKPKASATESTAKKTTRRAAAKKEADSPKPKRTRKKAGEPEATGNE